jgi:uncharacterized membrane protein YqjE
MEQAKPNEGGLVDSSEHLARRLLTIGENRVELLIVELQEERERCLRALALTLGAAAFGFFAVLALNAAIVICLWKFSQAGVLLTLAALYAAGAFALARQLKRVLRNWSSLSATLEELRKDRKCLEEDLL